MVFEVVDCGGVVVNVGVLVLIFGCLKRVCLQGVFGSFWVKSEAHCCFCDLLCSVGCEIKIWVELLKLTVVSMICSVQLDVFRSIHGDPSAILTFFICGNS
ncbi:hypothetical protein HanXRQr2_Chr14g0646341 [Helianthus annuus]|uniref:Uncharacterized protein n=1 Tax=Helianthus annuus TaxID=4232 RepID=A0A9K3H7Z2_HELAN|nr:hypothetical protein HanXRQr2_Chr14g0646341 [Helianthus annuus]